jgi:hypothetical protein
MVARLGQILFGQTMAYQGERGRRSILRFE